MPSYLYLNLVAFYNEVLPFAAVLFISGAYFYYKFDQFLGKPEAFWILLGFVWVLLIQGDSILLGPYARLEWGDGSPKYIGTIIHLVETGSNTYLHNFLYGTGKYSINQFGGEFLSLKNGLAKWFPFWVGIVLIRLVVTSTAFIGMYLLTTRRFNLFPIHGFALSTLFTVGFDFNTSLAYNWGLTFLAFPLILFFLHSGVINSFCILGYLLFCLFFVSLSYPLYALPMLLCLVLLMLATGRPKDYRFFVYGAMLLPILWVLNYSEVIFGILMNIQEVDRGPKGQTLGLIEHVKGVSSNVFNWKPRYNNGSWPVIACSVLVIFLSFTLRASRLIALILLALFFMYGLVPVMEILKKLPMFAHIKSYAIGVYNPMVFISSFILLAYQLSHVGKNTSKAIFPIPTQVISRWVFSVLLGVSCSFFVYLKYYTTRDMAFHGGLDTLVNVQNLKNNSDWYDADFRVVTIPYRLNPESVSGYGLRTIDGNVNFPPKSVVKYQKYIAPPPERGSGRNLDDFHKEYYLNSQLTIREFVSLDALRVANVKFIISMLPLVDSELRLITGPENHLLPPRALAQWGDHSWLIEPGYFRAYFENKNAYIYELRGTVPMVYSPKGIVKTVGESNSVYSTLVRENAIKGMFVTQDPSTAMREIGKMELLEFEIVPNGYVFYLNVQKGGLIGINVPYTRWWRASIGNRELPIFEGNIIHSAVDVPKGSYQLRLTYDRPMFSNHLKSIIGM